MHIFRGTRLGWYMAKPDRALKRPCARAGSIITAVKNPANSKPFRLNTGSQKSRATHAQAQAQAQAQAVCLPPGDSVADGAAAPQKKGVSSSPLALGTSTWCHIQQPSHFWAPDLGIHGGNQERCWKWNGWLRNARIAHIVKGRNRFSIKPSSGNIFPRSSTRSTAMPPGNPNMSMTTFAEDRSSLEPFTSCFRSMSACSWRSKDLWSTNSWTFSGRNAMNSDRETSIFLSCFLTIRDRILRRAKRCPKISTVQNGKQMYNFLRLQCVS